MFWNNRHLCLGVCVCLWSSAAKFVSTEKFNCLTIQNTKTIPIAQDEYTHYWCNSLVYYSWEKYQLMLWPKHDDKLNVGRLLRRLLKVAWDPTVGGLTWSRAFTQNPPLKEPCIHPSLSCPLSLPLCENRGYPGFKGQVHTKADSPKCLRCF